MMKKTTVVSRIKRIRSLLAGFLGLALLSCTGIPDGIQPVTGFDQSRYLGTWHEIARLDHSFERGLSEVTATYDLNPDGSIKVLNRGFDAEDGAWREAEGVARLMGAADIAHLKVSFFGPFYGSYIVFELGEDYDYAFVSGFNRDYLWLLSREPHITSELRSHFIETMTALDFDPTELVWLDKTDE
jgi:apolipoprotein D and lipocalin family protein